VLDQVQVMQKQQSSMASQIQENERRAQERHQQQIAYTERCVAGMVAYGRAVVHPPPRTVFGINHHNMSELEFSFAHPRRLGYVPLLPAPRSSIRPLLPAPRSSSLPLLPAPPLSSLPLLPAPPSSSLPLLPASLPEYQLALTTIDSHQPSTPVRSQKTADHVRAQTPTSAPPKKKLKVSGSAAPGGIGVAQETPPMPIPSLDATTIRGVADEWFTARPPYCSLRDMMKGEGEQFDDWRTHHKKTIDKRKNIFWAMTKHAKELEAESKPHAHVLVEVVRRLDEQKDSMEKKMTLLQFIHTLPKPPKNVWRFQI
jgi:hypothetical protein